MANRAWHFLILFKGEYIFSVDFVMDKHSPLRGSITFGIQIASHLELKCLVDCVNDWWRMLQSVEPK